MVLSLKRWKSRSSPGIEASAQTNTKTQSQRQPHRGAPASAHTEAFASGANITRPHNLKLGDAGWSSPVARQAHNLKVTGSNPVPATNSARTTHSTPIVAQAHASRHARLWHRQADPQPPANTATRSCARARQIVVFSVTIVRAVAAPCELLGLQAADALALVSSRRERR
jgi:hypothetical protein